MLIDLGKRNANQAPIQMMWHKTLTRPAMLAAAAWLVVVGGGASRQSLAEDAAKTVRLTIDYGDGVQKVFSGLAWSEKLTVLATLEAATRHPRGIKLAHRGSGATAFVTAIDGLKNEGRGRNWTYQVNDKRADRSCGVWNSRRATSCCGDLASD